MYKSLIWLHSVLYVMILFLRINHLFYAVFKNKCFLLWQNYHELGHMIYFNILANKYAWGDKSFFEYSGLNHNEFTFAKCGLR